MDTIDSVSGLRSPAKVTNGALHTVPSTVAPQTGGGVITPTTTRVTLATDGPGVSNLQLIADQTNSGDILASGNITTQNLVLAGAATANSAVAVATNGRPTLAFQVTGTYTGATLVAQATIDGAVWVTLNGILNANTGAFAASVTAAATGLFQVECVGFAQVRITASASMTGTAVISARASARMALIALDSPIPTGSNGIGSVTVSATTALTPGTAAANLGKAEDAAAASGDTGVFVLGVRRDVAVASASAAGDYNELAVGQFGDQYTSKLGTRKRSYSSAFSVVPAASATDIVEVVGSATTTVEITRITIGGIQTTAGQVLINILRRSTANTGGTSTNQTLVPHQATDASATAVIKAYTANPTTGTLVGNVRANRLPIGTTTSLIDPVVYEFGENTKPLFLAGVAQTLCINLAGATVTGATLDISIEFTEV